MDAELSPRLLKGRLTNVTAAGVTVELVGRMGVLHLPLRFVLTETPPAAGDEVELYLSYARQLKPRAGKEIAREKNAQAGNARVIA
jgi:hypothetical protein